MFRTLSPGDSMSKLWENCSKEAGPGVRLYSSLLQKGAGSIKLRNVAFYVLEEASLWSHRIHSFHVHLSYLGSILFPCSPCFLHSPSSSAITMGEGVSASTGSQFGEPSFTFGGQKSLMAVTFVVYWYSGDIFISLLKHLIKNILTIFVSQIWGDFVCYISSLTSQATLLLKLGLASAK